MGRIIKFLWIFCAIFIMCTVIFFSCDLFKPIALQLDLVDISTKDPEWNPDGDPIKAPTPIAQDFFGFSVDISDDFAVVGAYPNNGGRGAVYVFENAGGWQYQTTLTAADADPDDWFGRSVAVSGNFIVVGAPQYNVPEGAAYLFEYSGGSWIIPTALVATDGRLDFPVGSSPLGAGYSVDIDGDYVAVGSSYEETNDGAVYIFYRNEGSANSWDYQEKTQSGEADNRYGYVVSLSGAYLAVGTPLDDETETNSGAVYYHRRTGGSWSAAEKIKAQTPVNQNRFGESVGIYGNNLLIGEPPNNAAYLITISGSDWYRGQTVTSSNSATGDEFGYSVSITDDYLLVGAHKHVTSGKVDAGIAYIFENIEKIYEMEMITSDLPAASDKLGEAVAIDENFAIIGIPYDSETQTNSGKIIIYRKE